MERYICIHGHFYQPPRENPWLEVIEQQDEAHPYHDWNERITAECYAPNSTSRILDKQGRIEKIVNNYARISFNFGPTLLRWLEVNDPEVYGAIVEADRQSQQIYSGHGSALAQAYNHMILPLANRRDKYTQVLWGIRDFQYRFGREPEGMWLPETGVDLESLEILAKLGIRFTILAPRQALRVKQMHGGEWVDVGRERIDPTMAYTLRLPSGRTIAIFFYHGPMSRAVAFERVLKDGEGFARRLLDGFSDERNWPQLSHIATDGETYGHHHRFGDMALAFALNYIETKELARLTNYGEYLALHPPTHEVEIFENSSWSCPHGVERWRSDCGCHTGGHPEWNQAWRVSLRESLDWLRDAVASDFENKANELLHDPWSARNDYVEVVSDRSSAVIDEFLTKHARRSLSDTDTVTILKLLELQRHAMLMYTSCGWFFDDLAGIETVQVISYAARCLQLAQEIFGNSLESDFLEILGRAKSNRIRFGDGRQIYEQLVKPLVFDLAKVGVHYGAGALFNDYPEQAQVYCYTAEKQDHQSYETGTAKLIAGKTRITSDITRESSLFGYVVLHLGNHNLTVGVKEFSDHSSYEQATKELTAAFASTDLTQTIRLLDRSFAGATYNLKSLFPDEQRKILELVLQMSLEEAEAAYRQLYEHHGPLLRFLKEASGPPPKALYTAAEFVLNADLQRAFENEELNLARIEHLLQEAGLEGISLETTSLEFGLRKTLERLAAQLAADPSDFGMLERLEDATTLVSRLPFQVDLWKVQNTCYEMLQTVYEEYQVRAQQGHEEARTWLRHFNTIAQNLTVRV
jgi:alpha-amylase/alpha-mannosidase (GH57 family)